MLGSVIAGSFLLPGAAAAERVVFVNLEPVVLTNAAGQDPTQNSYNTTGFVPGPASGWPGLTDAQQTELLYWLKEASVPFDIVYTFERPVAGTYDMVVTGTAADNAALFPDLGCSAAIGLADCSDGNAENVSFFFWGCLPAGDEDDMHRVAFNLFAALGFGWGLENLTGSGQIMANYTPTSLEFGNVCTTIEGSQLCAGGHVGCPANQQNSTADLLDRIGPRVDDGPPTVTILAPEDGAAFESGVAVIDVDAAVGDLFGGLTVELEIVEVGQTQVDDQPPYSWTLAGIPDGMWTFRVNATDADGNLVSQEVAVCVGLAECGVGASTGADETGVGTSSSSGDEFTTEVFDDGGSTSTSGGSTGIIDEPDPVTSGAPPQVTSFGGDAPDTGCQCRGGGSGGGLVPGLGLLLLLGVRPRRA